MVDNVKTSSNILVLFINIVVLTSPSRTTWQSTWHRHLIQVARALLFQANLSTRYWGDAVLTATHIISCLTTPLLKWTKPYEFLYGRPLDCV